MSETYVSCKECKAPFVTTAEKDLADLDVDAGQTHVMECPLCHSLRPYVSDDALNLHG